MKIQASVAALAIAFLCCPTLTFAQVDPNSIIKGELQPLDQPKKQNRNSNLEHKIANNFISIGFYHAELANRKTNQYQETNR